MRFALAVGSASLAQHLLPLIHISRTQRKGRSPTVAAPTTPGRLHHKKGGSGQIQTWISPFSRGIKGDLAPSMGQRMTLCISRREAQTKAMPQARDTCFTLRVALIAQELASLASTSRRVVISDVLNQSQLMDLAPSEVGGAGAAILDLKVAMPKRAMDTPERRSRYRHRTFAYLASCL